MILAKNFRINSFILLFLYRESTMKSYWLYFPVISQIWPPSTPPVLTTPLEPLSSLSACSACLRPCLCSLLLSLCFLKQRAYFHLQGLCKDCSSVISMVNCPTYRFCSGVAFSVGPTLSSFWQPLPLPYAHFLVIVYLWPLSPNILFNYSSCCLSSDTRDWAAQGHWFFVLFCCSLVCPKQPNHAWPSINIVKRRTTTESINSVRLVTRLPAYSRFEKVNKIKDGTLLISTCAPWIWGYEVVALGKIGLENTAFTSLY